MKQISRARDTTNQKHYPDFGSDAVTGHQYGISSLLSQTSFRGGGGGGEPVGGVTKSRTFSQANKKRGKL